MNLKMLFPILAVMVAQPLLADAPPTGPVPPPAPVCQYLRTAKATVYIHKSFWEQDSGIWVQKSVELGTSTADVNVVAGVASGCKFPNAIRIDNVVLNGQTQAININAHIVNQDTSNNKVFVASYYLGADGGRTAYAEAWTPDVSTKTIGVNFGSERAADAATAHDDVLSVSVWFDDSAQ